MPSYSQMTLRGQLTLHYMITLLSTLRFHNTIILWMITKCIVLFSRLLYCVQFDDFFAIFVALCSQQYMICSVSVGALVLCLYGYTLMVAPY